VDRDNQARQEGKPRGTVKKGDNSRGLVEALLVRPPGLKGASGNLKRFGRLRQGEALGLQSKILIEEVSSLGSTPAGVMIIIASLRVLDDCSHRDLLFHPLPVYWGNGSGWRGRQLLSTLTSIEALIFWGPH
jgi:hypothetical protein